MIEMVGEGAPVFVKVDDYKEVLEVLDLIKEKVSDIKSTISDLNNMRSDEDAELAMWNSTISDIEKKIENIDKMMFQPEQTW
ncbi:MAG TPA: hypothetical protein VI564_01325 [Candidatus Nanoarchaeia archaeon]|nr:hypothetical protein [Candidatus Nanoarchaeia archaeon]